MQFKVRRKLGLFWCIPACLFLFNPVVAFVDVLPDAIGYALLLLGLRQAADLNGRLDESRSNFKKMLWVSVGAIAGEYYLYGVLPSGGTLNTYETPVWILLFSFALLAFHTVFLLPAYRELFLGLGVLCEECGREVPTDQKGKTRYERLASFSALFAVLTAALSCLPELSVLTPFEVEMEKMAFDWYAFVGLFRLVLSAVSLVFGLIWLCRALACFASLVRDRKTMEAMEARYTRDMLPKRGVLTLRRIGIAFILLMIGAVFIAEIRLDLRTLLPSPLCALFFLLALPFLGSFFPKRRLFASIALLQAVWGVGELLLCERYLKNYGTFEYALYLHEAYVDLWILRTVQIVGAVFTLLLVGALLLSLLKMSKCETAEVFDNDFFNVSARSTARLHKRFQKYTVVGISLMTLATAARITEIVLQLRAPWLWVVSLVFSIAAIISVFYLLFAIKDQLEWQYSAYDLNKIQKNCAYSNCNSNSNKKEYNQYAESEQSESEQPKAE